MLTIFIVNKSVYYEAQFKGQSDLGLEDGVIHAPLTVTSQKKLVKAAGVPKRKYVRKNKPAASDSAIDLMEFMINYDGNADQVLTHASASSPGGSQEEDDDLSDYAPETPTPYGARSQRPAPFTFYAADSQFGGLQLMGGAPQPTFTPSNSSTAVSHYDMQFMGMGAPPKPFTFYASNSHFGGIQLMGSVPQATPTPSSPSDVPRLPQAGPPVLVAASRKRAPASNNPLRQRLSENPSFESAVSVHGLDQIRAAGSAGLQRYHERQARGLPRAANASIPIQAASPPRNGTLGIPLTAANYAAAGMPNLAVEKPARRARKVDRRRKASTPSVIAAPASPFARAVPVSTALNAYGLPATIYGQASGPTYESHAYKSVYPEVAPKEQSFSLDDLSFPEFTSESTLPDLSASGFSFSELHSENPLAEEEISLLSHLETPCEVSLPEPATPILDSNHAPQGPSCEGIVGSSENEQVAAPANQVTESFFNDDFGAVIQNYSQHGSYGLAELGMDSACKSSFDEFSAQPSFMDGDDSVLDTDVAETADWFQDFLVSIGSSEVAGTSGSTDSDLQVMMTTSLRCGPDSQSLEEVHASVIADLQTSRSQGSDTDSSESYLFGVPSSPVAPATPPTQSSSEIADLVAALEKSRAEIASMEKRLEELRQLARRDSDRASAAATAKVDRRRVEARSRLSNTSSNSLPCASASTVGRSKPAASAKDPKKRVGPSKKPVPVASPAPTVKKTSSAVQLGFPSVAPPVLQNNGVKVAVKRPVSTSSKLNLLPTNLSVPTKPAVAASPKSSRTVKSSIPGKKPVGITKTVRPSSAKPLSDKSNHVRAMVKQVTAPPALVNVKIGKGVFKFMTPEEAATFKAGKTTLVVEPPKTVLKKPTVARSFASNILGITGLDTRGVVPPRRVYKYERLPLDSVKVNWTKQ